MYLQFHRPSDRVYIYLFVHVPDEMSAYIPPHASSVSSNRMSFSVRHQVSLRVSDQSSACFLPRASPDPSESDKYLVCFLTLFLSPRIKCILIFLYNRWGFPVQMSPDPRHAPWDRILLCFHLLYSPELTHPAFLLMSPRGDSAP